MTQEAPGPYEAKDNENEEDPWKWQENYPQPSRPENPRGEYYDDNPTPEPSPENEENAEYQDIGDELGEDGNLTRDGFPFLTREQVCTTSA